LSFVDRLYRFQQLGAINVRKFNKNDKKFKCRLYDESKLKKRGSVNFKICSQPLKPDFPDARVLGTVSKKLQTMGQSPGDFVGLKIALF